MVPEPNRYREMPGGPGTFHLLSSLQDLCGLTTKIRGMNAVYLQWMMLHFGYQPAINDTDLLRWTWSPEIKKTDIVIQTWSKWDPRSTGHRPAIIVKRRDFRRVKIGVRDAADTGGLGVTHFSYRYQGVHTLYCTSGNPVESGDLADEVANELGGSAFYVRRVLNLFRLELGNISEDVKLDEARENTTVGIDMQFEAERTFRVQGPQQISTIDRPITFGH
jgi:hypothetical protein